MKERRRHPRVTIMGLLRVILPGESKSKEAFLANISRGGIGVYLHREVRIGQKVQVIVYLEDKTGHEVEEIINSRVTWSNKVGTLHMAGLQFAKMPKHKYEAVLKSLFVLQQLA